MTKKKILIVDDEPSNLEAFHEMLRRDYEIDLVSTGQDGLDRALSIPAPDLILLDVTMPDMDGHEVCKRLKAEERCRDIPVIFVTGRSEIASESMGLEVGGADYIRKPFNVDVALARIRTHLELKAHRDLLRRKVKELSKDLERTEEEYLRLFAHGIGRKEPGKDE